MRKRIIVLTILVTTMACNLPIESQGNQVDATQQIATDVVHTLTAYVKPEKSKTQQPADSENPDAPEIITDITTSTVQSATATKQMPGATPSVTPTQPGGPKSTLGEPDWKVSFTNGKDGFYDEDDDQCIINAQNGKLVLTSTMKTTGWHSWSMHYHEIDNFYLEATVNTQACDGSDEYGIIYRAPDYTSGYFFGLTCDGKYNLRTLTGDYYTIIDWTSSDAIHAGSNQSNVIGVKANGNRVSLFINNEPLLEYDDLLFNKGGMFGVFIAAYQTPGFTIELDDMAYWMLDE